MIAADPEARNVKTVYILKMTSGLDQYLASELAQSGVYAVTTDPQRADALFTDSVGEPFEQKFAELYPPPKRVEEKKKEDEKEKEKEKAAGGSPADLLGASQFRMGGSSWGRGRGTVFLVGRANRSVLWSMQHAPKTTARPEMVKFAKAVTLQLRKDLGLVPAAK